MKRFIPRPSPAMVVACTALFVSLGGVSYGVATGFIDSREIRNNTIRGKDVRNGALTGKEFKRNSLSGVRVNEARLGIVPFGGVAQPPRGGQQPRPADPGTRRDQRGSHGQGALPGDLQPRCAGMRVRGQRG